MSSARRAAVASTWLEQLQFNMGRGQPFLVRGPDASYVIEGTYRRRVPSGLLASALEEVFGAARTASVDELERWGQSAPVEVLEGPMGAPFVVVGGRRLPIRGLPLPHPVSAEEMEQFPEGPELNLATANVARAQFASAVSGKYQLEQARGVLAREGPLRGTATLARRAGQRLRRAFGRAGE
jgi:hypothetical protein